MSQWCLPRAAEARGPEDAANGNSGFSKKDMGDGERLFNEICRYRRDNSEFWNDSGDDVI